LNLARAVPGKQEFNELLRYFRQGVARHGVTLKLNSRADAPSLAAGHYDRIVIATGVRPRLPQIPGIGHPTVVSYADLLSGRAQAGRRKAPGGAHQTSGDDSRHRLQPHQHARSGRRNPGQR
jgi:2,4-dienoyl-CoA reductase (NADPH2)